MIDPISRRDLLKLGLSTGTLPLFSWTPALVAGSLASPERAAAEADTVRARPLPLTAVRLTAGPLKHTQDLMGRYLLQLEPDRMLAYYRERAGLARKAEPYDGWDGGGRNLTGHTAGHYLSAVSLMFAATGDARFKTRGDYIVRELKEVQDKHGDGYLSALDGGREAFGRLARGEIRSASFDLNGLWSPWYTLHKTFAGLRDAHRHAGNRTALEVETKFATWAERLLSTLTDDQIQRMLNTEFGGMNEVLVDLYADTSDARWLKLSYAFEHRAFITPLVRHQDPLAGTHANTQVPKLTGSAERYRYTGQPADLLAAAFFWDRVTQHHSFSSSGHGTDEYFGPPDRLSDRVDGRTCESCNSYNMLKLTRLLFSFEPNVHYADFHERALFNHILASMDPEDGRVCYMVPVGRGVMHEYQDMAHSFTCCHGTGMESHALHGLGLYYEAGDRLWVNLFAPSTAEWSAAGVRLTMDTSFPEGESAKLTLTLRSPKAFTLMMRRPYWVTDGYQVKVNGAFVERPATPPPDSTLAGQRRPYEFAFPAGSYVEIARTWKSGDVVEVTLPKSLRLEPLPDNPKRASIMWGPLVLAGDNGPERRRARVEGEALEPAPVVPVFVTDSDSLWDWIKPAGEPGRFRTDGAGREPDAAGRARDVDLVSFYRLHRRTYSTYWDFFTTAEWAVQKSAYVAEAERLRRLEAATVAWLQPGETVFERQFNYQAGENASPQRILGRPGRRGRTWFSYDLPVEPTHPMTLIATYYSGDRRGTPADFVILVDGEPIGTQQVRFADPMKFYDVEYPVPERIVRGKATVTVRFEAKSGSQIATVFGLRMIRGNAPR